MIEDDGRRRERGRLHELFYLLDVVKLPTLIEVGLGRAVETEDWKPAFAGNSLNPVGFLLRLGRAEGDVD